MDPKMENLIKMLAKGLDYPVEWIRDGVLRGLDDINDIIDYCEFKKEQIERKRLDE